MRPPVLLALALTVLAPATPAAAKPSLHGIPAHVRAGTELKITWTGLGPEAHEAEVELSLAGGHWVRISRELEAREGGFTWHVPAGLSGPARVRLKYGGDWFEAESEISRPFRLESDTGPAVSPAPGPGMGEWWCADGGGAIPRPCFAGSSSIGPKTVDLEVVPEPDSGSRAAETAVHRWRPSQSVLASSAAPNASATPHRRYPLRI